MLLEYFFFGVIVFLIRGAQGLGEVTEVFAEEGSQAVLPCKCSLSSPTSAITWRRHNRGTVWRKEKSGLQYWGSNWSPKGIHRVQCPHSKFDKGDYSLQINEVMEEDGGLYFCKVENDQTTENMVTLRIIKVSISPSVPIRGSAVSIRCNVTPWPYGATVQWMLNNSPYGYQTTHRDTIPSPLTESATERLTGNWTCVVGYKGKEERATATLSMRGIIKPSNDNTKVYAAVGSAVTLPCVFYPGLIPTNATWKKVEPGSFVPGHLPASFSPPSPSSQPLVDQSASLEEVAFEDEGRYNCSATVNGQNLFRNMQLVVAKIDSSIPSKKRGSMKLTCQLTDTSEVTDYEWVHVVYDLNGTQSLGSIQKGKTLSISMVSEENWGEWICRFYGKEGILGNVTTHVHLMGGLSGEESTGISHNTAAVIGLSILLIVLLLVLVQMYKNHQRRKKIFQYPALETIVHTTSNEREQRERNREKK
ncbi:lymphocyte activation gene 3 protein [Symphorus nematophorus]